MEAVIKAGVRALGSIFAPGMFSVFVKSVLLTIAALIGFVMLTSTLFGWLSTQMGESPWAATLPWLGSVGSMLFAYFLFPTIMPIIVNFFDDRIARLIEQQDYPATIATNPTPFWSEFAHDARFSALAILLNILILPVYLLNGYLLGREFFIMAARRHVPVATAEDLRRRHSRRVLVAGILLAVLATLPLVNFLAPFWGIAVMVHLYHQLAKTPETQILPPK